MSVNGVIHVCLSCKDMDRDRRRAGLGGGPDLLAMVEALVAGHPELGLQARPQTCLGRCTRKGRMAIAAPGRWAWSFEAIEPRADRADLLTFLQAWLAAPDGLVPKDDRPPGLRKRLLGRIPPT